MGDAAGSGSGDDSGGGSFNASRSSDGMRIFGRSLKKESADAAGLLEDANPLEALNELVAPDEVDGMGNRLKDDPGVLCGWCPWSNAAANASDEVYRDAVAAP